jgi:hypothetical protein
MVWPSTFTVQTLTSSHAAVTLTRASLEQGSANFDTKRDSKCLEQTAVAT